jgi:hypothetical protein
MLTMLSCRFFVAPHLDNWVSESGRVFLIGDSAHAIPPTGMPSLSTPMCIIANGSGRGPRRSHGPRRR